jgi:glucose-6-phosphate 1-epimerase
MTITELDQKHGIDNCVLFYEGKGNLPFIEINSSYSQAVVSLYGAHVLNFIPKGETDLLWNTNSSLFQEGKAIRGGIPLCFPWFGPHATDSSKPQHGFIRLQTWSVVNASVLENGEVFLELELRENELSQAIWPYSFIAQLSVKVGLSLTVTLTIKNTDNKTFTYTDALHTYLQVGNVDAVKVEGLKDTSYIDTVKKNQCFEQQEDMLNIDQEINRRYRDTDKICTVHDSALNRIIVVSKSGSKTTVVWNPWAETIKKMADMDEDDFKTMLCIEAANALADTITLAPGESWSLSTTIALG